MDRVEKALQKLSKKERSVSKGILKKLHEQNFEGLDSKKLKGRDDIFRVRRGDIRIIYRKNEADALFILAIERRSEKTYRF